MTGASLRRSKGPQALLCLCLAVLVGTASLSGRACADEPAATERTGPTPPANAAPPPPSGGSAQTSAAPPANAAPPPPSGGSVGWVVVAASMVAGTVLTVHGLRIECGATDTGCQRKASLAIVGGVGVASLGSLIGLTVVRAESRAGGPSAVLHVTGRF